MNLFLAASSQGFVERIAVNKVTWILSGVCSILERLFEVPYHNYGAKRFCATVSQNKISVAAWKLLQPVTSFVNSCEEYYSDYRKQHIDVIIICIGVWEGMCLESCFINIFFSA